jgi:hypothetical protein
MGIVGWDGPGPVNSCTERHLHRFCNLSYNQHRLNLFRQWHKMLVLLPVFILILAASGILILSWIRPRYGYGYAWLGASSLAMVTWVLLLVMRWRTPAPFSIASWQSSKTLLEALNFQLDGVSWSYSFAMVSLVLTVVLTASARMNTSIPVSWAGSLAISGVALLAILATTPLALILAWTVIDLVELALLLRSSDQTRQAQQVVLSFSIRVLGTLSVILAMLVSQSQGGPLSLAQVNPESGIFLLIGAGLRLGVVPLYLPYRQEVRMRRGLGTILRLVAPATALPLLSRLPATVAPPQYAPYFLLFTALASLYGGAMWLFSTDELNGRPYWLIALAGMSVGGVIRGHPEATISWGVALIIAGGTLFLYSSRTRRLNYIPLVALLGLTGLPFTPAASGWGGLVVPPFNALDIVYMAAHSLVLMGFARHAMRPAAESPRMERWAEAMYPLGLLILTVSYWVIGLIGWKGSIAVGTWWAAVISTIAAVGGAILLQRMEHLPEDPATPLPAAPRGRIAPQAVVARLRWWVILSQRIGRGLSVILRLDWFYELFFLVYNLVQQIILFFTAILEGAGGMLWVILLLVIFVTLVGGGGKP